MTWEHVDGAELTALLDGMLPELRSVEIAEHLDECPLCMGQLQQLDDLHLVVAASTDPEVPEDLAAACWAAHLATPNDGTGLADADLDGTRSTDRVPHRLQPSAIAVAAMLFVSAAGLLLTAGVPDHAAHTLSAASVAVAAIARTAGLFASDTVLLGGGAAALVAASTIQLVRRRRTA